MKITAENLELTLKAGDTITLQELGISTLITYTAHTSNREQFDKLGVSSHSAELTYKEFVRICTHCLVRKKTDPVRKVTTYTYIKDRK